ncbi:bromodomain-containing protein 4 isoform X2 [Cephus cinctus]|uniref:Bromodomain-containing protein 4 isoform X2 n=1 Tax=Cephus cinctus TaxID=211228 RepID=A0AAJ7W6Q9_CEPCN|nr:bromodomain-containing protein 4 isoform X2 [Cephus cinctus]
MRDLEEALLTDGGTEGRLLQELIVRLLEGCLPNDTRNDISTFNYQMFLRRLFRKKCQEYKCENPFNTDVDFELLPLRQKVEILRSLCDFRLDAEDVEESLSNLDSDSLRVEPLGHDRKNSAYWYFYGTRLYREDYIGTFSSISQKQKGKPKDKKRKRRCRNRVAKEEEEKKEKKEEEDSLVEHEQDTDKAEEKPEEEKACESVWQVVCFTQQDWGRLVDKFRNSEYDIERKLYNTLSEDFMPEIPKLFDLKEKQQRRRLLQRTNSRILRSQEPAEESEAVMVRAKVKTKINKSSKKNSGQRSKGGEAEDGVPKANVAPPIQKKGRQTNNSLASAVGQIVIHTRDEVEDLGSKRGIGRHGITTYHSSNYGYGYGYGFGIEEEERRVGMHKVLESLKDHVDAWPFIDPVDEEYAPRYYSVVRRPMDLSTMEEKLEGGSYKSLSQFKRDFRLIVDNCRQYNGSDNEYTEMAVNLKEAFDRAVDRYLESEPSSDEGPPSPTPPPVLANPPPYPRRASSPSLPQQNPRKRGRKPNKKSKPNRPEKTAKEKLKNDEEEEEEEEAVKPIISEIESKLTKDKKGKKKLKKIKEVEPQDEDEDEEDKDQENDGAISEVNVIKSKRKKHMELLSKSKKILPKEEKAVESRKNSKRDTRVQQRVKEEMKLVHVMKAMKEDKKKKDDFEEDYDTQSIVKSKSKQIEKKEVQETLEKGTKRTKQKKAESQENCKAQEEENGPAQAKTKKTRRDEKVELELFERTNEKSDTKGSSKEKDKKSKMNKQERVKNGVMKNQENSDTTSGSKFEADDDKMDPTSKKFASLVRNKDLESLDSLKDRISERRREEKLKLEREKLKKTSKDSGRGVYPKKVPSNGSSLQDAGKVNKKQLRPKKTTKEDKGSGNSKNQEQEVIETKKSKTLQSKHAKGFGSEEGTNIQALNQATEQTLNDINKWLDDTPRLSEFSSGSDSPIFHPSTSEPLRTGTKPDVSRKRPSSTKLFGPNGPPRPKKVQRTIDRLQPGKSKGNLLLKKPLHLPSNTINDTASIQATSDTDQTNRDTLEEPKLSLGTVLRNADSIQLICKSLVSSPNPNLSNEDDDEDHPGIPASTSTSIKEEKATIGKETTVPVTTSGESIESSSRVISEDSQKPKSATPNLSAWFKAFGAPKSKKKEEEVEESVTKKESDTPEVCTRQRRLSTGGSSVSESVSSFSQESPPPGRSGKSPQNQPLPIPAEPQIRGAGFYQDALSTGSSPYNSPYYTTPPRYSAQLPPTPSPQNNPISPAYPSSSPYDQATSLYPQVAPQPSLQSYQKAPLDNPGDYRQLSPTFSQRSPQNANYPQNSPQSQSYSQQLPSGSQNQSPVYPQHSPQSIPTNYPQSSPQTPSSYSQPSPQQPPTPNYNQPSPQAAPANYSQPSPQQPPTYSQPSPQQHSNYSQPSPQPPPSYSQPSPQQPPTYSQHSPQTPGSYSQPSPQPLSNYSQPSPQPPGYSQPSPQPPSSYPQPSTQPSNYNQPSPQPPGYSQSSPQHPPGYSQSSPQNLAYSQPSPQNSGYSQPSSQQSLSFSQSSPKPTANYSQPSPQQPPSYSHPSPQRPPTYSQMSPQQAPVSTYSQPSSQQPRNYSQPSPQQTSNCPQPSASQPTANYSQPSPQQPSNYTQVVKNSDNYPQNAAPGYPPQSFKQNPSYLPLANESDRRAEFLKPTEGKSQSVVEQHRNFVGQNEPTLSPNIAHQVYQGPNQYPTAYGNTFSGSDRPVNINTDPQRPSSRIEEQNPHQPQERHGFPAPNDSLNVQKYAQAVTQQRSFLCKPSSGGEQLQPADQSQLLSFQQNIPPHESLYQSATGFQTPPYPMPNSSCRPVYPSPHYFDTSAKGSPVAPTTSNLAPVKKRMYNEPAESSRNLPQDPGRPQDQFGFDPIMSLSQAEPVPGGQFDSTFGSLADSVASNPAYARLGLGIVGRGNKEQQQLLTIPRPPTKPDPMTYARSPAPTSDLDLNLLQSLNATAKNPGMLSVPRRPPEVPATPANTKAKKSRKNKQQQNVAPVPPQGNIEQQSGSAIPGFPQYSTSPTDPIALKNASIVPPGGSAFNFAAPSGTANSSPFYDKDTAAVATFAFLDEFRNPSSYYNMALRQQQQQQQQQQGTPVTDASQQACNKLNNQPPRNYPPHPFLHSTQRSAAYGPPVSAYVGPHGPNLGVDPAYQQYIHSLYALQPPPHHHRPSWL